MNALNPNRLRDDRLSVVAFPGIVGVLARGDRVTLDDNRTGYIQARHFAIDAAGRATLESYIVALVGGRGSIEITPDRIRAGNVVRLHPARAQ